MHTSDLSLRNLDTARRLLLEPYGLDDAILLRNLAEMFSHRIDYADLYFQYTRSEGWGLEEGIVKSGSFNIDQGVGVRAVTGDRTAFAYSGDISVQALKEAVESTRAIARLHTGHSHQIKKLSAIGGMLYMHRKTP